MEKIVKTINHLGDGFHHKEKKSVSDGFHHIKQSTGDGFHQMKKVLMGKDQSVATQQFQGEFKLYWKTALCSQIKHLTDVSSRNPIKAL